MSSLFNPSNFVSISAGSFIMGASDLPGASPHEVTITQSFLLGRFPVTNADFEQFAADRGVPLMAERYSIGIANRDLGCDFCGDENPAVRVTHHMARSYADWLTWRYQDSPRDLGDGRFALPTEAQWEYAARAGRTEEVAKYATANGKLERGLALYDAGGRSTGPVGQFESNPWGLHDMSGNVYEWVNDWYGAYALAPQVDPQGPNSGQYRVLRGGSWHSNNDDALRSAYRDGGSPAGGGNVIGLRVGFFPST